LDHRSFRDQLAFSIGFAVSRSRVLLRRLLKEHRRELAERVVEQLELSGLKLTKPSRL
jgi:hypothetical protein